MSADTSAQATSPPSAPRERLVELVKSNERRFWLALGCALVVHLSLLIGVVRQLPKQMGEATGQPDGISVELIDKADLEAKNTFAEDAAGAAAKPVPPPKLASRPPPPQPTPAPKEPPPPEADDAHEDTPEKAPDKAPEKASEKAAEKAAEKANPWAAQVEAPNVASPPAESEQLKLSDLPLKIPPKKQQAAEHTPPQPKKPLEKPPEKTQDKLALNFDLPPQAFAPGATGAAVMRPPGITRSGENDEFGRGVIRALRRTMPTSKMLGQVTVRFLLSETGNLLDVRVVSPSRDPVFDQNIVFSVRQASFPIPPQGSNTADRMFQVTYIYH